MSPQPDPIFKATTPVPGEDLRGTMTQQSMPGSPLFWGRKYVPPSPSEAAAGRGPQPFPKLMYHPDGRMQPAATKDDYDEAVKNGWRDEPDLSHREMLQTGDGGNSGKRMATAGSPDSGGVVQGKEQPKWGLAALATTTKVTEHHVRFLKSRGYPVAAIKEVDGFVEKLSTEEAAQFFSDAAEWKESKESKESKEPKEPVA